MQRIRVRVQQLGERHFQVNLCSRVAIITQTLLRAGKGGRMARVKAGYFGFDDFDDAQAFADSVRRRYPKARIQVRASKRLATAFEVKVAHDAVEALAWEMAHRQPTTSQRIEQHVQQHSRFIQSHSAPQFNRSAARKTLTGSAGFTVGIE
jgi:hypothetical protein